MLQIAASEEGYTGKGHDYGGMVAEALAAAARKHDPRPTRRYLVADACGTLPFEEAGFTHAVCMLAIQNVENPRNLVANAAARLAPGGRFVLVLNHPCFRIPRQTSWEVDLKRHIRFRRVDRYLSRMRAAIAMNPGLGAASAETWSFHAPLSDIFSWLKDAGLLVEGLEEWVSHKRSEGPAAVMENRARAEFPLFLAIAALKRG